MIKSAYKVTADDLKAGKVVRFKRGLYECSLYEHKGNYVVEEYDGFRLNIQHSTYRQLRPARSRFSRAKLFVQLQRG